MSRKRLLWQLFPSYLLITLFSIVAVAWFAVHELREFHLRQTIEDLTARAHLFQRYLAGRPLAEGTEGIDVLCKEIGKSFSTRITVILPDGRVVGDSERTPNLMDNHADRPEIQEALSGKTGWEMRRSSTLKQKMMYVAVPTYSNGRIAAIVRASLSVTAFEKALEAVYIKVALVVVGIIALTVVLCYFASKRLAYPLEKMKHGIMELTKGDLSYKLPIPDSEELGVLAEAMNEMAGELAERIRTITQQRNEQESIFGSMIEGVLAVDKEERVLRMNCAAEEILGENAQTAKGRFIQEVVPNPELRAFIKMALDSQGPTEGDIVWHGTKERFFQVRGTALRDPAGEGIGAVVVLNEVTRLYQLEQVRRDFVANVSHELRTPITSILGFAETLLDDDGKDAKDTEKFLTIIVRQANRLNAIIEDLLALSRIERQSEQKEVRLASGILKDVLRSAIQTCELRTAEQNISVNLICSDEMVANINAELLERAVANLVENAVKYSEENTQITIECVGGDHDIHIHVRDQGCGIAKEHQARLFERFYRVDKARSRKLGGTGLGLAIVKHIAQAHGGRVFVESAPGKGSVFTIILPRS